MNAKLLFWLFLSLFVIEISSGLAAQEPVPEESESVWVEGLGNPEVARLSEDVLAITGLYHTHGEGGVAAGIILTQESVIFSDAGMTIASAEFIWNTAQEVMGERKNVLLILTHHHSDHTFGMRVFKDKGAKVIAHSGVKMFFSMRGMVYKEFLLNRLGWDAKKGDEIFSHILIGPV